MPIFRVKSVKIYTGQKDLHVHVRGDRDKYQVCIDVTSIEFRQNTAKNIIWIKELWKFVLFFSFTICNFSLLFQNLQFPSSFKNFPFSLPPADHAIQIHGGKVLLHAQIQLKFEVNR